MVYASAANITDHRARGDLGNATATYVYPITFLNSNFNAVYTDGSSEVFDK